MFKIPPITKNLLLINVLMYFAAVLLGNSGIDLNNLLGLHFFKSESFAPYQLVTYMFMHANFEHIFFNMLAFWMFGRVLEQIWGPKRYLIFYMVCGIGAGLCQEAVQYIDYVSQGLAQYSVVTDGNIRMPMSAYLDMWTTVGASGAIYGVLLGFGMSFPNERILLLIPPVPIKAKYLVIGYAVLELLLGVGVSNSSVAHFAHLGGMLFGLILILYWRRDARRKAYGFSSWSEYSPGKKSFWSRMKEKGAAQTQRRQPEAQSAPKSAPKADPMAERKAKQDEIDRILEKVRRSGYSGLTDQEKKALFDFTDRR